MLRSFVEHPFGAWIVTVLAVMAGFLVIKFLASKLPSGGVPGAIQSAVMAA